MKFTVNKKYDRLEFNNYHIYNNNRGEKGGGNKIYEGFFKCKLVHNNMFSVIIPDLIYIKTAEDTFLWFQFYSFLPNHLSKFSSEEIMGIVDVDIAFGHTLRIVFSKKGHVKNFPDQSNLFQCEIYGPDDLLEYSTGCGKIIDETPYIKLYHHTLPDIKVLIENSSYYKGSLWNFQGTKKLKSICYSYFTSLDKIIQEQDLLAIAMSSDGTINLVLDITLEPISIKVYRESTSNRTATLEQYIDSTIIMNNHIWMHKHDTNEYVYYEVCSSFIYRVGLDIQTDLPFNDSIISRVENVMTPDYVVLGDAATKLGLLAPFDEEFTTHVFKIEPFDGVETNILDFWFDNSNKDLYTDKKITPPKFE
ncbi:hypothetical protein [Flavobacterium beibuense]|uniref:Transposase n=1 Tax=Flavobacterium beibuense TaxID=657326 RepID=A0A444WJ33_9FLAO|nr:hypothetical protein [Flavobacterium beibuense]RYJ45692.1 Transposase [Flavobacterium beibuense]